jgi:plasmid stabilization system protein ParE
MFDLGIHLEAEQEVDEAFTYYESEQPGLGFQFIEHYREQLEQAVRFPGTGTPAVGYSTHDVRKFHFAQFPYALVVAMVGSQRIVVAVSHYKRHPDYWRDRLEP